MPETPQPLPAPVRTVVALHAQTVHRAHAQIARLRALEARLGSPGRYEWAYRLTAEPAALAALARLAALEACALAQGISLAALYAHVPEGRPTLQDWSAAALAWRDGPATQETPPH